MAVKYSGSIDVVHRLSLWTAIKMRIAGRDYFDGYTDGTHDTCMTQIENGEYDVPGAEEDDD